MKLTYTQSFTITIAPNGFGREPFMKHGEYVAIRKKHRMDWQFALVCVGCSRPFGDDDNMHIVISGNGSEVGNRFMCTACVDKYLPELEAEGLHATVIVPDPDLMEAAS